MHCPDCVADGIRERGAVLIIITTSSARSIAPCQE
jgi:hypothetical protein